MRWVRSLGSLLVVAVAAGCVVVAPFAGVASAAETEMALGLGDAVLWNGVLVADGKVSDPASCDRPTPCPIWTVRIAEGGARLRVALDTPSREDTFTFEVINPKGAVVARDSTSNQFNSEAFALSPVAGLWKVRVIPTAVTQATFRMRAKLERTLPVKAAGKVALLPNLKTVPPYEFGFIAPANPLNAVYPPDTVNPGLDVAGVHPLSCAADESAPVAAGGGGAVKCLRLTSGPINVGAGAFEMRFNFATDLAARKVAAETLQGPSAQAVHYSDGSTQLRPAGSYSFHKTHAHFHTDQILSYDLFKVDDPRTGTMRVVGAGTKSGFCPADQLFGEWSKFNQLASGTFGEGDSATGGNCFSPEGGVIGLSVGWGDVYRWQRPGQYVEFGGQGDGLYVVQTTADKFDNVLEENERDNTSYAYIEVKGETIRSIERGQGVSPWDPTKLVFVGAGPASVDVGGPTVYLREAVPAVVAAQASPGPAVAGQLPETGLDQSARMSAAVLTLGAALVLRARRRLSLRG